MARPRKACETCRERKIKCDKTRPVCKRCLIDHRQCSGSGFSSRLVVKDETQTTIDRWSGEKPSALSLRPTEDKSSEIAVDRTVWPAAANQRLYNEVEQPYLAIICCREVMTLRSLKWVLSAGGSYEGVFEAMQKSDALACAIRANAVKYLAEGFGAREPPHQAIIEYTSALRLLQKDLYDPEKQRSNETLFTVLLLGIFDILNAQGLDSWKVHVRGACKIIECNGPEEYMTLNTGARRLVEYVRGMDVMRAMSREEETMFGYKIWDCLSPSISDPPIDTIFYFYGKIANLIARRTELDALSLVNSVFLYNQLHAIKSALEEWRIRLPAIYEPVSLSACLGSDDANVLVGYPYDERLEYIEPFMGHTMNLYKAAILAIDMFLRDHMTPAAPICESNIRHAHGIVMSMPSLCKYGSLFLSFPCRQAARVLSKPYREYIASALMKVVTEVPAVIYTVIAIQKANVLEL